ncbi:unnamed protein product, partial [Ixodes hexagonus]
GGPFCDLDDTLPESESIPLSFLSPASSYQILPQPDIHSSLLRVSVASPSPDETTVRISDDNIENLVYRPKETSSTDTGGHDNLRPSYSQEVKELRVKFIGKLELPKNDTTEDPIMRGATSPTILTSTPETKDSEQQTTKCSNVIPENPPPHVSIAAERDANESNSSTELQCLAELLSSMKVVMLGNEHYKREKSLLHSPGTSSGFSQPSKIAPLVGGLNAHGANSGKESTDASLRPVPTPTLSPYSASAPFNREKTPFHSKLPSLKETAESTTEGPSAATCRASPLLETVRSTSSTRLPLRIRRSGERSVANIRTPPGHAATRYRPYEAHRLKSGSRNRLFFSSADGRPVPMKRSIKFRRIGNSQLQVIVESMHDTQLDGPPNLANPTPSLGEGESGREMSRAQLVPSSNVGDMMNERVLKLDMPAELLLTSKATTETQVSIQSSQLYVETSKEPDDLKTSLMSPAARLCSFGPPYAAHKKRRPGRFWSEPQQPTGFFFSRKRYSEPFPRQLGSSRIKVTEPISATPQSSSSDLDPPSLRSFYFDSTSECTYSSELAIPSSLVTTTWNEQDVPSRFSETTLTREANLAMLATKSKESFKQPSRTCDIFRRPSNTALTNSKSDYEELLDESKVGGQGRMNYTTSTAEAESVTLTHYDTEDTFLNSRSQTADVVESKVQLLRRLFEERHSALSGTRNNANSTSGRKPCGSPKFSQLTKRRTMLPRRPVSQSLSSRVAPNSGSSFLLRRMRAVQQLTDPVDRVARMPTPETTDLHIKISPSISPSTSFAVTSFSSYAATSRSASMGCDSVYNLITPALASTTASSISKPPTDLWRAPTMRRPSERRSSSSSKPSVRKEKNMFKLMARMGIRKAGRPKGTRKYRRHVEEAISPPAFLPARFQQRERPESSTSFSVLETSLAESLLAVTSADADPAVYTSPPFPPSYMPSLDGEFSQGTPSPRDIEWYSCPSSSLE